MGLQPLLKRLIRMTLQYSLGKRYPSVECSVPQFKWTTCSLMVLKFPKQSIKREKGQDCTLKANGGL